MRVRATCTDIIHNALPLRNKPASRTLAVGKLLVRLIAMLTLTACMPFCLHAHGIERLYSLVGNKPTAELSALGSKYLAKGDKVDSAAVCFTLIVNRHYANTSKDGDKAYTAKAMNDLGYIYMFHYFDFNKAYSYLLQAKEVAEDGGLKGELPVIYLNLASLFFNSGQAYNIHTPTADGLMWLKKSINASLEVSDWRILNYAMNNLLNSTVSYGNTQEAADEIAHYREAKMPEGVVMRRFTLLHCDGVEALSRGDCRKAIACFRRMTGCIDTHETPERYEMMALNNISIAYERSGDTAAAANEAEKARALAQRYGYKDVLVNFYRDLSRLYAGMGLKARADSMYVKGVLENDSLLSRQRMADVARLNFQHELDKSTEEVRQLSARRKAQDALIAVLSVSVVITLSFLAYIAAKARERRRMNADLYKRNREILANDDILRKLVSEMEEKLEQNRAATGTGGTGQQKYSTSNLDEESKTAILSKIINVMKSDSAIFSDSFSLARLAESVGCKPNHVSLVLNEKLGKNFYALIGEYRIKEACRMLDDSRKYGNYTIEGIASSVGFKSRTNFMAAFKKQTGLTPTQYRKQASIQ